MGCVMESSRTSEVEVDFCPQCFRKLKDKHFCPRCQLAIEIVKFVSLETLRDQAKKRRMLRRHRV